jgi:cell division protein FtsN
MANERIPNDPYRPTFAGDDLRGDDLRGPARLDNELQPDPELAEGRASGGRVAMFAIAIAVVLGVVFYGLNSTSINQAGTSSTAQNAAPTSTAQNNTQPPAAPPGMRDVTPHANAQPGVTTGAAPARPQTPPSAAPTGQDMNRAGGAPGNNAPK